MGVVNVTEDSFSDGGAFLDPGKAVEQGLRLVADGADVVELGPASSHPDSRRVTAAEEIRRLEPVVGRLLAEGIVVSVDSFLWETQQWALLNGVSILNDIQGFPDARHYGELAAADPQLVVMHSVQGRGAATRVRTEAAGIVERMSAFFRERVGALVDAGIARERIMVDPGMGFFLGDEAEPSLLALRELSGIRERTGCRVLVSVSRKSFLGTVTGRGVQERAAATLAAELYAVVRHGVDVVRTHDVGALRDALAVWEALGE